jgi:prepilin-type N-terminal cleavage/methylation domain-containing protein
MYPDQFSYSYSRQLQGLLKQMKDITKQSGFTITEMLITIALSLSVMSSVMVGYLATYTSSMDTLASSKMNQDINAVSALMISELRRSGYSGSAATESLSLY